MVVYEEYGEWVETALQTRTGRKGVRTCSNRSNHPPGHKPLATSATAQRSSEIVQSASIATTASKWASVKGRPWALPARRSTSMPLSLFRSPRSRSFVETETEDDEIPLYAIELRYPRKVRPGLEAEYLEQLEARLVVGEGARDQGLQAQSRGAAYGLSEQVLSDPFSAMLCCYVDADLRGRVGRRAVCGKAQS